MACVGIQDKLSIKPSKLSLTGFLPVLNTHTLYWKESGNPEGQVRIIDVWMFLLESLKNSMFWRCYGKLTFGAILQSIIFLHGGLGSGTSGGNRHFFDPEYYHIILFDQVGYSPVFCAQ
jgi:proline iminopeptidase